MIPVSDQVIFQDALNCLLEHKKNVGREFKGRFIQIFLGLKFYQNSIPSMYSNSFITTEVLQSLLDDLYEKTSCAANQSVLALFENRFLARTGLVSPGNKGSQNTWRNNFNLQKGIGCYAPPSDLSSLVFLDQDRSQCRYLQTQVSGSLKSAQCSLCTSGASYRNESHRKWLRIDPGGNGYAITDIQQISNFEPYVAPSRNRIPIIPLIVALYHDADPGLVLGTRSNVDLTTFMSDFNLSTAEVSAYFDDSPQHPLNAILMRSRTWPVSASLGPRLAVRPVSQATLPPASPPITIPTVPILSGTPTPPPSLNSGWEAEQYVEAALTSSGWVAHGVARQQLGYDIFATKGQRKLYIEVKSSLGSCSPSLTSREWQLAKHYSSKYVLAIVENFNPVSQNTIFWIPDPANCCISVEKSTVSFRVSRNSWILSTVSLDKL